MTPIPLNLPRFDYRNEDGVVVVREGFVVTFFIPPGHDEDPSAFHDAAMRYLSASGVPTTLAAFDDDDEPIAQGSAAIAELLRDAATSADESASVVVRDAVSDDSGFSLTYFQTGLRRTVHDNWPNAGTGLRFSFPYEFSESSVLLHLRDFADAVAERLPFSSGYVAPAFLFDDGLYRRSAFEIIKGISRRYLCLDIPDLIVDCFEVCRGVKGAYWGNYLSQSVTSGLGGIDHICSQFAPFDTRSRSLKNGGLAFYLNPYPIAGDVNRQEDVRVYAAAAELLSPSIPQRNVPYSGFSDEEMTSWATRFGRFGTTDEEDR